MSKNKNRRPIDTSMIGNVERPININNGVSDVTDNGDNEINEEVIVETENTDTEDYTEDQSVEETVVEETVDSNEEVNMAEEEPVANEEAAKDPTIDDTSTDEDSNTVVEEFLPQKDDEVKDEVKLVVKSTATASLSNILCSINNNKKFKGHAYLDNDYIVVDVVNKSEVKKLQKY